MPFDPSRNWPDLGSRFSKGEKALRDAVRVPEMTSSEEDDDSSAGTEREEKVTTRDDMDDEVDLSWSTVLKRTFEAYLRAERPNAYGEELLWESV